MFWNHVEVCSVICSPRQLQEIILNSKFWYQMVGKAISAWFKRQNFLAHFQALSRKGLCSFKIFSCYYTLFSCHCMQFLINETPDLSCDLFLPVFLFFLRLIKLLYEFPKRSHNKNAQNIHITLIAWKVTNRK